jgi:abortive infection bacteriophage resistance protein
MRGYLFLGIEKMKPAFNKPATTIDQQLDLLISRGMIVKNRPQAIHYLAHLNYYRLGAYWLTFESDHQSHQFKPETHFEDVVNLYVFDRELRLLVLDAIERIEVSIRSQWAYTLAHQYGSHPHLDPNLFKPKWDYQLNKKKLEAELARSKEAFVKHFNHSYTEELPPVWAICEIMALGTLSQWFGNLRSGQDRNRIARIYNVDELILTSFLHHLSFIRNICAHHSRLWNREFTMTFQLPKKSPVGLPPCFNPNAPRKIYNSLVMLVFLLDIISPQHHWRCRLFDLLNKHHIDTKAMGFPAGWQSLAVWF